MYVHKGADGQSLNHCPVYILAGGQSRRMGRPKALLPFPDVPLLLVLINRLGLAFRHIYVVCSPTAGGVLGDIQKTLSDYGLRNRVLLDPFPNGGPLGGLARATEHTRQLGYPRCLVIPCDMPFLTMTFLARLVSTHPTAPAVIPSTADGRLTGVCAAYNVGIQPALVTFLQQGGRRVHEFLQTLSAASLPFSDYADLPNADRLLYNLNTPDEYHQALIWYREAQLENSLSDETCRQPR